MINVKTPNLQSSWKYTGSPTWYTQLIHLIQLIHNIDANAAFKIQLSAALFTDREDILIEDS